MALPRLVLARSARHRPVGVEVSPLSPVRLVATPAQDRHLVAEQPTVVGDNRAARIGRVLLGQGADLAQPARLPSIPHIREVGPKTRVDRHTEGAKRVEAPAHEVRKAIAMAAPTSDEVGIRTHAPIPGVQNGARDPWHGIVDAGIASRAASLQQRVGVIHRDC